MLGQTSYQSNLGPCLDWRPVHYVSNIPPYIPSKNHSYFFLLSGYFFSISWFLGAFIFIFSFFVHSCQTAKVLIFLILRANELQKEACLKDLLLIVFSAFNFFTLTHLAFVKKGREERYFSLMCTFSVTHTPGLWCG